MDQIKKTNFQKMKRTTFKPDRKYIEKAMEEYKNRGGRIEKKNSNGRYNNDEMPEAKLFSENTGWLKLGQNNPL